MTDEQRQQITTKEWLKYIGTSEIILMSLRVKKDTTALACDVT